MTQELKNKVKSLFREKNFLEIKNLYHINTSVFEIDLFLLEGICLSESNLGNDVEAIVFAKKILTIDPNHIGAHHVLAKSLANINIDESINYYKKLLRLSKSSAIYLTEYAGLLFSLGVYDEPIQIFQDLVKKFPENISFIISLSRIYIENNDYDFAIDLLKKLLTTKNPRIIKHEILNLIGTAYHNKGSYSSAKNYYEESIRNNKNFIEPYINLGVLDQENGNFDDARVVLDKANKLRKNAECYRMIAAGKKFSDKDDPDILTMLGMESSAQINEGDRSALHFGLGKAYEDLKDYEKSAQYYLNGNQIRRAIFKNYNFQKELDIFIDMQKIFDNYYFSKFSEKNDKFGKGLIFIVGMPRSGTTLLEQVLSSHNEVYGAGELNYFTQAIDNILNVFDFDNFKKKILNLKKEEILKIGNYYVSKIKSKTGNIANKNYIIDKNHINFKNIPLIHNSLPGAKIIHIKRNQNDNCLSIFKNFFYHNVMPWSYSQNELKDYYVTYVNFMKHFKNTIPNYIYEVEYENLISDLEGQISLILKFIGLSWDPNCLEFYKNKRSVRTASINQVRQNIYQTSKNSWENYKKYFHELFI